MRTERAELVMEKTSPNFVTALLAVAVSTVLSVGFSKLLGSTFGVPFSNSRLIIASLVTALVFAVIFFFNKKWVSFAALISAPLIFTACVYYDRFDVKKGILGLMYYIKLYVFLWIEGDFPEDPNGDRTILAFFIAYNLVAISCTVFVIMKRKWIPAVLIFYAPLFLCSVANTDLSPKPIPCLIAGTGVVMLLLCHAFRKKKQSTYEKVLMIIAVPVLCIMLLLGGIFPQKKYNKDKLAEKIIIETRDWFDKTMGRDNPLRRFFDIALEGLETTDFDDSFDAISPLYSTPTNLAKVGPFNPSNEDVLKVYRYGNPDYDGTGKQYQGNILYLKVESSDTYHNNTLSSSKIKMRVYDRNKTAEPEQAQYCVTITPLKSTSVDIVPYYTDFYTMSSVRETKINPLNATRERIFTFASSNIPVKNGNIYSEQYLNNYVYKTCLEVPYSTDRALIGGGNLPRWYLDVYYGRIEMSDAEKVKAVTEFVRNLHPYDMNTEYPPRNADFVPWFVNQGKSGICVHYAATSMVLLRMIGIPARYVRGYVDSNSVMDRESIVNASQAHAWFEYFVPEYGWVMGDATPGYQTDESNFNIEAISKEHPEINTSDFGKSENDETTATETETETETSEISEETTSSSETSASETTTGENGETAASSYGPSVSGSGDPTAVDMNKNRDTGSELPKFLMNFLKFMLAVVIAMAVLAFLVLAGRIALVIYWSKKFRAEKINDRAIAYYHYYMLMARIFRFVFPSEVDSVAEKARFSGRDITAGEYDAIVKKCPELMKMVSVDFSRPKKLLFKLMLMPQTKEK